jgi:hypothetical protein
MSLIQNLSATDLCRYVLSLNTLTELETELFKHLDALTNVLVEADVSTDAALLRRELLATDEDVLR